MDEKKFQELVSNYLSEQCTAAEIGVLHSLLEDPKYVNLLETLMEQQLNENIQSGDAYPEFVSRLKNMILKKIEEERKPHKSSVIYFLKRYRAVAALLVVAAGVFIWLTKNNTASVDKKPVASAKTEIVPGKEGAILTLADGKTIVLDSSGVGLIASQSGTDIVLSEGQIVYKPNNPSEVVYNTLSTPKGRQFRLILPDGTAAWLNAASSLRYPAVFSGQERKVEVTGEVYFEVVKNEKIPFIVKVNEGIEVKVLGTHFNINSYTNESSVNTTLLEGSVQISNNGQEAIIKPGQQAQISSNQKIKVVNDVNLRKVMSWKDGVFDFNNANLQEVMRQIERWYDIEVVYEKGVPDIEFVGTMGRDLKLEDVLKGLKLSEVNFRIEGRKLIVMP